MNYVLVYLCQLTSKRSKKMAIEDLHEKQAFGFFDFFTKKWHIWNELPAVYPSHFQLLTMPKQ